MTTHSSQAEEAPMPTVRTTLRPDVEQEVDAEEYEVLRGMGLLHSPPPLIDLVGDAPAAPRRQDTVPAAAVVEPAAEETPAAPDSPTTKKG